MATREELMGGFQFVPAQAKRVASMLDGLSEWDTKRVQGWTPRKRCSRTSPWSPE